MVKDVFESLKDYIWYSGLFLIISGVLQLGLWGGMPASVKESKLKSANDQSRISQDDNAKDITIFDLNILDVKQEEIESLPEKKKERKRPSYFGKKKIRDYASLVSAIKENE